MTLHFKTALAVATLWSVTGAYTGVQAQLDASLSREEAITRAVKAAPILDAMRENIGAFDASIKQAGVKPNPEIGAEIENFTGTGPYTGLDRSEVTFSYAQKYERGGKRSLRKRVAREDKNISLAEWHIRRLDIIRQAEQAYVAVVAAQARLENRERQMAIFKNIEETIKKRVTAGRDSDLAAQNAHIRYLGAINRSAQARLDLEAAKVALASLWQGQGGSITVDASELAGLPDAMSPRTGDMVRNGPDLHLWRLRQEKSKATLDLEKARAIQDPTFSFGVRYHQNSTDLAAVAGVSLPLALYDLNKGNINRATAELNRSRYELNDVERSLARQLMMAHAEQGTAFTQARQLASNLTTARETKSLVMARLERGAASYLDVFAAQSLVAEIEEQRIDALSRFHMAQVTINRLTAKYDDSDAPAPNSTEGAADNADARRGF